MRTRSRKGILKKERDQPGRTSMDTAWRKHDRAMRHGTFLLPGSASSDSALSRRNTVMSALPHKNGVIHAYQSDTSSTQSVPSVLPFLLRYTRVRDGPPLHGIPSTLDTGRSISARRFSSGHQIRTFLVKAPGSIPTDCVPKRTGGRSPPSFSLVLFRRVTSSRPVA